MKVNKRTANSNGAINIQIERIYQPVGPNIAENLFFGYPYIFLKSFMNRVDPECQNLYLYYTNSNLYRKYTLLQLIQIKRRA